MVRKIFNFLYKENNNLNGAAFLLGFFAILSQILAFIRDRLLAHVFGASAELDIYYAAFRVPDFIFVSVASVVSISVLVPFIVEKESLGRDALKKFMDNVLSFFLLLISGISMITFFLMPYISEFLFRGFSETALDKVILISRILLISPIFLGLSNLLGSLTQAYNRFTIYALSPLFYNLGIITGIVFLSEKFGVVGVAMGVILGAILHAMVQVPFVFAQKLLPKFVLKPDFSSILEVVKISLPRTLTLSMVSLEMIFLTAMASILAVGSVSVLSLSWNLQSVVLSIIGVSYSLAAFPTLSRYFKENNIEAFLKQMSDTARFIIFWALPLATLFIVLRAQVVRTLLGTGNFDWTDTRLTAAALALFSLSAVFQCLSLLFIRGFYSAGETKKPFFVNLLSSSVLVLSTLYFTKIFYSFPELRYFLESILRVEDLPGTAVLVLPLGFTIASAINCLTHWVLFERRFKGFSSLVLKALLKSLGASTIMGVAAYWALTIFSYLIDTSSLIGIFLQGLLSGIIAIIVGILILHVTKSQEFSEIVRSIKGKLWRTTVIATDPEIV